MPSLDLDAIVNDFYVPVFRYAASLTREPHTAADLTQQAFLTLARNQNALRDHSRVKSWLHTTLFREFLHQRSRQSRWTHDEHMPEPTDEQLPVPGTELGADEKPPSSADSTPSSRCIATPFACATCTASTTAPLRAASIFRWAPSCRASPAPTAGWPATSRNRRPRCSQPALRADGPLPWHRLCSFAPPPFPANSLL